MGNNQVVPMNSLFFSTSMPSPKLDREVGLKLLCAGIEKVQPDVLIIDPVYKFTSDSSESVLLRFTDNMDYLIQHYGLSLILVHHARKPGTTPTGEEINQGGSELRGPVLEQWADGIIRITGELNSYDRTLDFELRHAETIQGPINIRLDPNKLWFSRV
jgi:predicted ATP-dependent serine protease